MRMTEEAFANHQRWKDKEAKRASMAESIATIESVCAAVQAIDKASKYGNVKTDGYASKKEARRAAALKALEQAGAIRNLREQIPYILIPRQLDADGSVGERACTYKADFVYEENGVEVVEDCKGMRTPDYIIKRKLMRFQFGVVIRET